MALGPGRYDDHAERILKETEAEAVLVLVVKGNKGSGFSCKAPIAITLMLPAILRRLAQDIEETHREGEL
jgi:hypothetical protein